jgi:hypothetical protein
MSEAEVSTPTRKLGQVARVPKKVVAPPPPKAKTLKAKAPVQATNGKEVKEPKAKAERKTTGPRGTRGMTGTTTGLGIIAFQNRLLDKNYKAKLTDEELAEAMREEFPAAIPYTTKHVAGIRSSYNTGNHGNDKPEIALPRYGEDKKPITRGARAPKAEAAPAPKAKVTAKSKKVN